MGKFSVYIFEECGFDTEIIGMARINAASKRWQAAYYPIIFYSKLKLLCRRLVCLGNETRSTTSTIGVFFFCVNT